MYSRNPWLRGSLITGGRGFFRENSGAMQLKVEGRDSSKVDLEVVFTSQARRLILSPKVGENLRGGTLLREPLN